LLRDTSTLAQESMSQCLGESDEPLSQRRHGPGMDIADQPQ